MPLICATCQSQAPHGSHNCLYCGASLITKRTLSPATSKVLPQLQARKKIPQSELDISLDPLSSGDFGEGGPDTIRSFPSSLLIDDDSDFAQLDDDYELSLSQSDIVLIQSHHDDEPQLDAVDVDEAAVELLVAEDISPYAIPNVTAQEPNQGDAWNPQQTMDESLDGLPGLADFEDLSASRDNYAQADGKPARRAHLADLKTPISAIPIAKYRPENHTTTHSNAKKKKKKKSKRSSFQDQQSTAILDHQTTGKSIGSKIGLVFIGSMIGVALMFMNQPLPFTKWIASFNASTPSQLTPKTVQPKHNASLSRSTQTKQKNTGLKSDDFASKTHKAVKPLGPFQRDLIKHYRLLQNYLQFWQQNIYQKLSPQWSVKQKREHLEWLAHLYMTTYEIAHWKQLDDLNAQWIKKAYQYTQQAQVFKASHQQMALKIRRAITQNRHQLAQELMNETKELSQSTWLVGDHLNAVLPFINLRMQKTAPSGNKFKALAKLAQVNQASSSTITKKNPTNTTSSDTKKHKTQQSPSSLSHYKAIPSYALMYGIQVAETYKMNQEITTWQTLYLQALEQELEYIRTIHHQQITYYETTSSPSKTKPKKKSKRRKVNTLPKSKSDPNQLSTEELYSKASQYLNRGRTQQARTYLGLLLEKEPGHINALAQLAWCSVDEGRFSNARNVFQQVLRKSPYHADSLYGLGYVFDKMGQKESARKYYDLYLQKYPSGSKNRIIRRKLQNL